MKTVYFLQGHNLNEAVCRPIYDYAKGKEHDVQWGKEYPAISSHTMDRNTIYIPHGISRENLFDTRKKTAETNPVGLLLPGPYWKENFNIDPTSPYARTKLHIAPHQLTEFSLYLKKKYPENKMKVVGWPKSDLLFSPKRRREMKEKWENILKLPYDKTLLYTHSPFIEDFVKITENLGVNLIHRPHPLAIRAWPPFEGAVEEQHIRFRDAEKTYRKFKHVNWISPELADITELFPISDVAVTNPGSSVATEFIITGKPVISFTNKSMVSGFTFEDENNLPAITCGLKGLNEAIDRCLENPNEFQSQREAWLEKMIYKPDGNASERAWKAIMELVG